MWWLMASTSGAIGRFDQGAAETGWMPTSDTMAGGASEARLEALAGGRATIERHKPVMLIESIKTDKAALLKFLEEHGYQTFPMGINVLAVHSTDPTREQISVQS